MGYPVILGKMDCLNVNLLVFHIYHTTFAQYDLPSGAQVCTYMLLFIKAYNNVIMFVTL